MHDGDDGQLGHRPRWHIHDQRTLVDCRVFTVDAISCSADPEILADGAGQAANLAPENADPSHDFFVINSPDFVNVVALTDDGHCVLVEQWRHGTQDHTLEIPGGLVDAGEDPETAARRELLEETGYVAETWIEVGQCRPNAAIQSNRCTTFLALGATKVAEPQFDGTEHCVLHTQPWTEVVQMVRDGRIDHALVVAAVLYVRLQLAAV
ncbi:MAG: NUDIX hydrolase [Myxococcales bacterium]|nr:NUDIX hydrolase [Myxococcales bacterium]